MIVVAARVRRNAGHVAGVDDVPGEQLPKIDVIADDSDHRGAVVIERCEAVHRLVGPGSGPVLQSDRVKITRGVHARRAVHRVVGRLGQPASTADCAGHGVEHGVSGRNTGQAVVYAARLLTRPRHGRGGQQRSAENPWDKIIFHNFLHCNVASRIAITVHELGRVWASNIHVSAAREGFCGGRHKKPSERENSRKH